MKMKFVFIGFIVNFKASFINNGINGILLLPLWLSALVADILRGK